LPFCERQILLSVENNGQGFNTNEITHLGCLRNMKHYAEEINGKFAIHSKQGEGKIINLSILFYKH
jgi:signal transduction histidine kinase